jgi:antitoxin (DNA-binding transcriptional repressor) of toxin-antitoxin stability system
MKTMTATRARQNLGTILSRVLQGEDIGIVHSGTGKVVALRPVEVYSEDYALIEYGITEKELKKAVKNINKVARHEKTTRWSGTAKSLRS